MTARCPTHSLALTSTGRCNGCVADHLGGLHTIPDPACERCTTPPTDMDRQTAASGERQD